MASLEPVDEVNVPVMAVISENMKSDGLENGNFCNLHRDRVAARKHG